MKTIKFKDNVKVLCRGVYTTNDRDEIDTDETIIGEGNLIGYIENGNYKWLHSQMTLRAKDKSYYATSGTTKNMKLLISLIEFVLE